MKEFLDQDSLDRVNEGQNKKKSSPWAQIHELSIGDKKKKAFLNNLGYKSKTKKFFEENPDLINTAIKAGSIAAGFDKKLVKNTFMINNINEQRTIAKEKFKNALMYRKNIAESLKKEEKLHILKQILNGRSEGRMSWTVEMLFRAALANIQKKNDRNNSEDVISVKYLQNFYTKNLGLVTAKELKLPLSYQKDQKRTKVLMMIYRDCLFEARMAEELYSRIRNGAELPNNNAKFNSWEKRREKALEWKSEVAEELPQTKVSTTIEIEELEDVPPGYYDGADEYYSDMEKENTITSLSERNSIQSTEESFLKNKTESTNEEINEESDEIDFMEVLNGKN